MCEKHSELKLNTVCKEKSNNGLIICSLIQWLFFFKCTGFNSWNWCSLFFFIIFSFLVYEKLFYLYYTYISMNAPTVSQWGPPLNVTIFYHNTHSPLHVQNGSWGGLSCFGDHRKHANKSSIKEVVSLWKAVHNFSDHKKMSGRFWIISQSAKESCEEYCCHTLLLPSKLTTSKPSKRHDILSLRVFFPCSILLL